MAALQPAGVVKQILDQVIVGNKLTPPSDPLKLNIGGIIYRVSATKINDYFSARFMTEQTDAARRKLPSRDIETEKKRAGALAENILNIHRHAIDGNIKVLKQLISENINPDITGADGYTPLILAAIYGHKEVAELLLKKGANVNARDFDGYSTLNNAATFGNTEVVELLLQKGANVNVSDYNGCSPLRNAAPFGYTEIAELLLESGADVDAADKDGNTPLMKAVIYGYAQIVRLLLGNGAGADTRNKNGLSLIIEAATFGKTEIAKLLLESGADVDAADKHGRTPLTKAAANGHSKIVELLLDYGADPNQSENTKSPLTCTIRELIKSNEDNRAGLIEAMRLLLANGADITGQWEDEANPGAGLTIKDKIVLLSNDYDINLEALNRPGSAQASRFPHRMTLKMQARRTVINAVKANKQNKPLPEALKELPLPDSIREMLLNK